MRLYSKRDLKMLGRLWLGSHSPTYPLLRLAPQRPGFASNREKMVGKDTDICIDGFPHSGNTFFTRLVSYWNPGLKIARHMHVPEQIRRAVALGIPTLVLIRAPEKALTSILYRYPDLHPKTACEYYERFYRSLLPLRDRLLAVDFDRMIRNPTRFIEEANQKFSGDLKHEPFDEMLEEKIVRMVPSKIEKQKSDEAVKKRAEIENRISTLPLFDRTRTVYQQYFR